MPAVGANAGVLNIGVNVDLSTFNSAMGQIDQRAAKTAQGINNLGSSFGAGLSIGTGIAAATAAFGAMEGAVAGAAKSVLTLSSSLEQSRISFTAFLGDAGKANDFIKSLQDLAAHTTFEFPGLLQMSKQLMGMGIAGDQVIPILKDVAAAVMAVGGGELQIKRVNLAITQMLAAGKVNAQDMNQLAQAGIPAWKLLADSMGMTIGQVRELSKQGQISSAQMLKALDTFAHSADVSDIFAKASQTWEAASSNMIDGLRNLATEGFSPLFNMARDGLVALADLLTSDASKQWAADLKASVQDVISSFQPLTDAITKAFTAFKTDGAGAAFDSLLQSAKDLATQMFGAGVNVVAEFASGLLSGAGDLIAQAANAIAQTIADYLIGESPPPVGPLSAIATGGAAVIQAYVDGMQTGLQGIGDIAQQVSDALGNVAKSLTLTEANAELRAAGQNLDALKNVANDVDGAIRTIDASIKDSQASLRDYQNAVSDIKDAYDAVIDPLQKQVDALKEVNDLSQKQADLQDKIALAQMKGKLAQAQGDPVLRAQLQSRLDALQQQEKGIGLQESSLRLQQQQQDLADKAAGKKPNDKDNTQTSQRLNQLSQQRLGIQQQENQLQQQLEGMVDKEAVARIKAQEAQVTAVKDQRDLNAEIADLNRQLAAAPLEAQIKDLKAQEDALIKPIQERIKENQKELQNLQEQRAQWTAIKQAVTDLTQATKEQQKAAEEAGKKAALANPNDLKGIITPEAIQHQAELVGKSFVTGFTNWLKANAPQMIGGAIGGMIGEALFGPIGALAGAKFGSEFVKSMQTRFGSLEEIGGKIAGKISDALNIDTGGANNSLEAFAIIFETMRDRALAALENLRSGAAQKVQDIQGVLSDFQGKWQEAFGDKSAGAQAGIQAIDGVNTAFQSLQLFLSGDFKAALDTLKISFGELGTAGSLAATQTQTSFQDLQNTLAPIEPVIAGIATAFVAFRTISATVSGIAAAAATIAGVIATIAGIATVVGMAIESIAAGAGIFETIGAAAGLLGISLTGVGAIILAVSALIGLFTAAWLGNWGNIQQITMTAIAAIQTGFASMMAFLSDTWATIVSTALGAWQGLQDGITAGIATVQGLWAAGWKMLGDTVLAAWNIISPENQTKIAELIALTTQLWDTLQQLWTAGTTALSNLLSSWWATVSALVAGYWKEFTDGVTKLWADITTLWDTNTKGLSNLLNIAYALIAAATDEMFTSMKTKWEQAKTDMAALATTLGTSIMEALTAAINAAVGTVVAAVTDSVRKALEAARGLLGTFTSANMPGGSGAGGMTNMSLRTGGVSSGPLMSVDTSSQQAALRSWVGALMDAERKTGIPAATLWGIIRAENGGGQSSLSKDSNNYFSISAVPGRANQSGVAPGGRFASYATPQASLDDFLALITQSPAYAGANANKADVDKFVKALVDAHYIVPEAGFPVDTWIKNVQSGATQFNDVIPSLGLQNMNVNPNLMSLNKTQITAGAEAGLTPQAASAACGPYAAMLFAQATGRMPNMAEATQLAKETGWTAQAGMGGTGNFMSLLSKMGLDAVRMAATPANIDAALAAGNPIALSTPKHYFVGSGGTAAGGINVGSTGTVMGGAGTMTLEQITALGGGMNDLIVLTGTLNTTGTQTFNNLTAVSGQFGQQITDNTTIMADANTQMAETGSAANDALTASTTTLAESISSGLVPAGLAARDAVGAMSLGIQPLISQFANGQLTSEQLGQSIVQLASSSGLATAPLQQLAAGNVSVDAALQEVLTSLAQADPAFAAIQAQFNQTQQSSGALADVLLQGLGNVTGQLTPSLQQMATAALPLQQAFEGGSISSEQFVQSVVQLAATSGLAQAPLRLMQDGVIGTNDALAQVVQAAGAADPAIASMGASIGDSVQPATDAATAFLTWIESLQQTQQAVTDSNTAVEQIPQAVTDIQQPVDDAAQQTMQVLPDAAASAVDTTIQAIAGKAGDAANAATTVGQAVVDALVSTVQAGAAAVADAAMKIIQDALDAAKKAADEATKNLSSKTDSGGSGSSSKKTKTKTSTKAGGGVLTPGVWTLVGEEGPELISPSGYVYTAQETLGMVADGAQRGLLTIEKYASGGQSKTKSKSSSSKSKSSGGSDSGSSSAAPAAPAKVQAPKTTEELDLEQKILEITQQRDKLLVTMQPVQEAIRKEEEAMQIAQKGSLADQQKVITNKTASLQIESQIYHLTYDSDALHTSTHDIELKIRDVKKQQEDASKGDLQTQQKLASLNYVKLQNDQAIAQIEASALPLRQQEASIQDQMAKAQKGTLEEQIQSNSLQMQKDQGLIQENALQQQSAGLRAEVAAQEAVVAKLAKGSVDDQKKLADIGKQRADIALQQAQEQAAMIPIQNQIAALQKSIDDTLKGSAADQKIIHDNAAAMLVIDGQELAIKQQQLPIQESMRKVQADIDAITKGSVSDQQAAVDLSTEQAKIQLQEIDINAKLRNINAGTLSMSQEQINALHKQLEVLDNQKANLDDQTQTKALQAQVASADAQKQLIALQAQSAVQDDQLAALDSQKNILQNQSDIITNTNQQAASSQQDQLSTLQDQLKVHQDSSDTLSAQDAILQAQAGVINANSQVQVATANATLVDLTNQLSVYDEQITKIQAQNAAIDLQMTGLTLQQTARSDILNTQLISVQAQLAAYNDQETALNNQNAAVAAQSNLITANNALSAAGYTAELIAMQAVLDARNLQIQKLDDQKTLLDEQSAEITRQNSIAAAGHEFNLAALNAQLSVQQQQSDYLNAQIGALNAQKKIYEDIRALADAIANRPVSAPAAPAPVGGGTSGGPPGTIAATATKDGNQTLYLSRGTGIDGWYTASGQLVVQGGSASPPSGYKVKYMAAGGPLKAGEWAVTGENGPELIRAQSDMVVFPHERSQSIARGWANGITSANDDGAGGAQRNVVVNVEYHRHSGTDYGEGTLPQVIREAVNMALRQ